MLNQYRRISVIPVTPPSANRLAMLINTSPNA